MVRVKPMWKITLLLLSVFIYRTQVEERKFWEFMWNCKDEEAIPNIGTAFSSTLSEKWSVWKRAGRREICWWNEDNKEALLWTRTVTYGWNLNRPLAIRTKSSKKKTSQCWKLIKMWVLNVDINSSCCCLSELEIKKVEMG